MDKRLAGIAAVVLALTAGTFLLLRDDPYTVRAQFHNAGQLVEGGRVQVAGRKVGSISSIELTPDGLAEVELSIDDQSVVPLRRGTRASIRALGQAGVANRRVELSPAPSSEPALEEGAVLPVEQTAGIVDLDAVLSSFGPAQRANLQELIANSARIYAGSGSSYFNGMLAKLDPALAELSGLTAELASDRAAIERLVRTAGQSASAIASRRTDLRSAVANTARSLGAIASERRALSDLLARAPAVLRQAGGTLAEADRAVRVLRPALREIPAVGAPLRELLRRTISTLPAARPVVGDLRAQLPGLRESLAGLKPLERPAVRALDSSARAFNDSRHILRGSRIYGTDFTLGVLSSLGGLASNNYNRWGHYMRLEFVQPLQFLLAGRTSPLLSQQPLIPGLFDMRTGLTQRCPGGNAAPAPDGSSPWIPDSSICNPEHNIPGFVNEPGGIKP